jgi:hypothetical protein
MRREDRRRIAAVAAIIVLVVVIVLLAGTGGGPGPTTAPPPTPVPTAIAYGANVNRLFDDAGTFTPAQLGAQLAALRATGATLARGDALWERSEPAPGHFDWSFDDRQVAALARYRLTWLPILDYSANWAQSIPGSLHSPPSSLSAYAAYAGALAARYRPGGTFWREHPRLPSLPVTTYEIWNEPDNPAFWYPAPNARRYGQLYLAARAAIKTADPSAQVLVGGLTKPTSFLPALLDAEPALASSLDGVAIHPYGLGPQAVVSAVAGARRTLDLLALQNVPLYITEFGWTTSPPGAVDGAPESLRPGFIGKTITALARTGCGLAAVLLYTWVTPERDPANAQDWFGISPPAGGTSRDVQSFTRAVRDAGAVAAPTAPCP